MTNSSETITEIGEYIRRTIPLAQDGYIFRGAEDTYDLLPGILREKTQMQIKGENLEYNSNRDIPRERVMFQEFKSRSLPYLDFTPRHDIEWLAIAQHHGMKTRLLDWTDSPLVALFFAVKHMGAAAHNSKRQPIVYALKIENKDIINAENDDIDKLLSIAKPHLYRPPLIAPRIAAQSSVFTIQSTKIDDTDRSLKFHKVLISKNSEGSLKKDLNHLGISYQSLLDDINGLSQSLNWDFKWGEKLLRRPLTS